LICIFVSAIRTIKADFTYFYIGNAYKNTFVSVINTAPLTFLSTTLRSQDYKKIVIHPFDYKKSLVQCVGFLFALEAVTD
jgi:hypothetical protein